MHAQGSQTAVLVAAYRARAASSHPALCPDVFAARLVGEEGLALAKQTNLSFPQADLWIALRTASFDRLITRVCSGNDAIEQIVLLGAGLDARAARLRRPGLRFFEVDHPASQADKLRRLRSMNDYPGNAATYVPCDLEGEDFLAALVTHGLDLHRDALFVLEGVTYYLRDETLAHTLRRIATASTPGSVVAFDCGSYAVEIDDGHSQAMREHVRALGEPMRSTFPDAGALCRTEGLSSVERRSFDELCLALTADRSHAGELAGHEIVAASRTRTGLL